MIIGLTGPTGSGKSAISNHLKEKGFFVIDSDEIVKNLYVNCSECIAAVDRCFSGVLENNVVNKKKLSKIVLNNKDLLLKLCEAVNPYILRQIEIEINQKNCGDIILDAPALFESEAHKFCDRSLAILSKKQIRLSRILDRDGITYYDAVRRINMQPKDDFYVKYADEIVFNNSELCDCINSIECVLHKYHSF